MKRYSLPIKWVRWRRRRFQNLRAGLDQDLAWRLADGEAKARHRAARIIGYDRACAAEFTFMGDRFVLVGGGLSDAQLEAIKAVNQRDMPATA